MNDKPLAIVIAAVINRGRILLIKRIKGDYIGLWGLPGGKIEQNEHMSDAAIREIEEETGIKCDFTAYLGHVSEHLIEHKKIIQHFLLHLCQLKPRAKKKIDFPEGKIKWFSLRQIEQNKGIIIPSDAYMIRNLIINKKKNYYNCVLEKRGDNYKLIKFG